MLHRLRTAHTTLLFALALVAPLTACADGVTVVNAWVRTPAPGQTTASAYIELTSARDAALVGARSAVAARVEMHSMTMDGGVMRMRALPRIELPAGQTVKLAPGGTHLMLIDLQQPLKAGATVPLILSVQPSGPSGGRSLTTLTIQAEVRPAAVSQPQHQH